MLQAERDGDGETVHQAPEGCALAVHIDEDFAELTVFVLACAEVNALAADLAFLCIAATPVRQTFAVGHIFVDDSLGSFYHHILGLGGFGINCCFGYIFLFFDLLENFAHRVQGLAQFRTVAVKGIGFEHHLPGEHVGTFEVLNIGFIHQVDGFGDGA